MSSEMVAVDDATELQTEALTWPERAKAVRVVDSRSYVGAADLLKGIKALRLKIAETFDPHIDRAHKAHKALVAEKKAAEAPLETAEREIKSRMATYDTEQERIRLAEQRRLAEEARQAEEARRLAEAEMAEASGDHDEAAAILEEAVAAPAPVISIPKATPEVAGVSHRTTYRAEVRDLKALVVYVGAHPEHANLILPNMPALNGMARAMREGLALPGVVAVAERSTAVRV